MLLPCGNGLDQRHVRSDAVVGAQHPSHTNAHSHQAVARRGRRGERLNMGLMRKLLMTPSGGNGLIAKDPESFIQGGTNSIAEG